MSCPALQQQSKKHSSVNPRSTRQSIQEALVSKHLRRSRPKGTCARVGGVGLNRHSKFHDIMSLWRRCTPGGFRRSSVREGTKGTERKT